MKRGKLLDNGGWATVSSGISNRDMFNLHAIEMAC